MPSDGMKFNKKGVIYLANTNAPIFISFIILLTIHYFEVKSRRQISGDIDNPLTRLSFRNTTIVLFALTGIFVYFFVCNPRDIFAVIGTFFFGYKFANELVRYLRILVHQCIDQKIGGDGP